MNALLERVHRLASQFLGTLSARPVGARTNAESLRAALGGPLPETGADPLEVIEALARGVEPGLVAMPGPRFFGFVIGGSLPAALGADWLTSTWDQNAGMFAGSPAAATVEQIAAGWLLELLRLPPTASVGFVTGGQMANFTCLAAARHEVLRRAGWDVERDGLHGGPPLHVVVGAEAHVTIFAALRMLGLGEGRARRVATDAQGRMLPEALHQALQGCDGPIIVCAQAGNVNSGAIDPLRELAHVAHARGAWLHVDGAFGLWASAAPALRQAVEGIELADSWATDAHKWLNVPYDSGLAIVAHPAPHRAAMSSRAAYLVQSPDGEREPMDWVPEVSRRARGFAVYAALRSLGRQGVAELVERCCRLARRMADRLSAQPGVAILNEVSLNQVVVAFAPPPHVDAEGFTQAVVQRIQREGTCWLAGTTWRGQSGIRISVSNWSTTEADIDRSADAILEAYRSEKRPA